MSGGAGRPSSRATHGVLVALFYILLAVAATWPVAAAGLSRLPSDPGDPVMSVSLVHWTLTHAPLGAAWWDGPGFYPLSRTMAWSDPRLGVSLLAAPFAWATGSTPAGYGAVFVLSFALVGIATHALVYSLTRHGAAALVAGCASACSPVRVAHFSHIELLTTFWMPVALAAAHRHARTGSRGALALFTGALVLQGVFGTSLLPYFAVLIALWILWLAGSGGGRRAIELAAAAAIAAGVVVALLPPYLTAHREISLHRGIEEIATFSADLSGLWNGAPALRAWPWHQAPNAEGFLFMGVTAALVVLIGASRWREGRDAPWRRRVRRGLLVLAIVAASVAVVAWAGVDSEVAVGSLRVSFRAFRKPLSVAAIAGSAWCLLLPRVVSAIRRRSVPGFYVCVTPVLLFLALGPAPSAFGVPFLYEAPYSLLMRLPVFSGTLRAPGRFGLLAALTLAVASGLMWDRLSRGWMAVARLRVTAVLVVVILIEGWAAPLAMTPAPVAFAWPAACADLPRLELPLGDVAAEAAAQYRAARDGVRSINGASGYVPPHVIALAEAVSRREVEALRPFAEHSSFCLTIDRASNDSLASSIQALAATDALTRSDSRPAGRSFFLVHRQPASRAVEPIAGPLPLAAAVPSVGELNAAELHDGDPVTGWITPEYQAVGDSLVVRLGCLAAANAVTLSQGAFAAGFPRVLAVDVEREQGQWETAWEGSTASMVVQAGLDRPGRPTITLPIAAPPTRRLRLRLTAAAPAHWAVAELAVEGRCEGGGT